MKKLLFVSAGMLATAFITAYPANTQEKVQLPGNSVEFQARDEASSLVDRIDSILSRVEVLLSGNPALIHSEPPAHIVQTTTVDPKRVAVMPPLPQVETVIKEVAEVEKE